MVTYQISSGFGGPVIQSDFHDVSETLQICLSHLVKRLYDEGHVEGLSLEGFQKRLEHGMDTLRKDFNNSVFGDNHKEVYGTFECEFNWPTNSYPDAFTDIFMEASNIEYVFSQRSHHPSAIYEIQIMISDSDDNWLSFVAGDISEHKGFALNER